MMTTEYKRRRRRMSPERRAADRARCAKLSVKLQRYVPNPLTQADTVRMAEEELEVVQAIRARGTWVQMWTLLNALAGAGTESVKRHRRQAYLALLNRLLRERKLVRHRPSNSIALTPDLR